MIVKLLAQLGGDCFKCLGVQLGPEFGPQRDGDSLLSSPPQALRPRGTARCNNAAKSRVWSASCSNTNGFRCVCTAVDQKIGKLPMPQHSAGYSAWSVPKAGSRRLQGLIAAAGFAARFRRTVHPALRRESGVRFRSWPATRAWSTFTLGNRVRQTTPPAANRRLLRASIGSSQSRQIGRREG